jgi:hypothetical protein
MHVCSQGGKSVHAPRSQMSGLDFHTEPLFDCADDDSGDIAFIWATKFVGGRDTMEEFLACGVYLLAANVGFDSGSWCDLDFKVEDAPVEVCGRS